MRSLRIHEYGAALQTDEVAEPAAGPGQVVVRIKATSLNPIDTGRASGMMRELFPIEFPWTPGGDFSGIVASVGAGVTSIAIGDEVFGYSMAGGAYAQLIAMDASQVVAKPGALTHEKAAAIALVGQTAIQALLAAELQAGQTVLIHGGAGAVGSLAIQLAHKQGVRVITTALDSQRDALTKLGAERVIDYNQSRFEDEIDPVDAVLDLIGGDVQQRSFNIIKPSGFLVAANQPPDAGQCELHHIKGVMVQTEVTTQGLKDFADQVVAGEIVATIAFTETLWNPERIWAKRPAGSSVGKVVFTVDS